MLVEAKYLGKGQLETVQDAGHSPKIVSCSFQEGVTEPAVGDFLTIEDTHIVRGESDSASYRMRTPLSATGEVITAEDIAKNQASKDQELAELRAKMAAQESAAKDKEIADLKAQLAAGRGA